MSLLKDLEESNPSLRSIALSLIISPFWYLTIYLINNKFYHTADITILVIISCILSFLSVFSFTVISSNYIEEVKSDLIGDDDFFHSMIVSSFILIIWKSVLLFIVYSVGFIFNKYIYLYYYIIIYFSINVVLILYIIFRKENNNKIKKK